MIVTGGYGAPRSGSLAVFGYGRSSVLPTVGAMLVSWEPPQFLWKLKALRTLPPTTGRGLS